MIMMAHELHGLDTDLHGFFLDYDYLHSHKLLKINTLIIENIDVILSKIVLYSN